jgi:hypothetical protein
VWTKLKSKDIRRVLATGWFRLMQNTYLERLNLIKKDKAMNVFDDHMNCLAINKLAIIVLLGLRILQT